MATRIAQPRLVTAPPPVCVDAPEESHQPWPLGDIRSMFVSVLDDECRWLSTLPPVLEYASLYWKAHAALPALEPGGTTPRCRRPGVTPPFPLQPGLPPGPVRTGHRRLSGTPGACPGRTPVFFLCANRGAVGTACVPLRLRLRLGPRHWAGRRLSRLAGGHGACGCRVAPGARARRPSPRRPRDADAPRVHPGMAPRERLRPDAGPARPTAPRPVAAVRVAGGPRQRRPDAPPAAVLLCPARAAPREPRRALCRRDCTCRCCPPLP